MSLQTFPRKQSLTALTWRFAGAKCATAGKELATGKARSPMVERRVRRTTSDDDEAERSRWWVPQLGTAELSGVNIWTQSTLAPLAKCSYVTSGLMPNSIIPITINKINRIKTCKKARLWVNFECEKSTRILYVRIKYSMRDPIHDVTIHCALSCDMGKIINDKWQMIKFKSKTEKEKQRDMKNFHINVNVV